jgi:hypothetical protein
VRGDREGEAENGKRANHHIAYARKRDSGDICDGKNNPMSPTKVSIIGALRFSDGDGLLYSLPIGKDEKQTTIWLDTIPNTLDWPGLGKYPEKPKPAAPPTWRDRQADSKVHEKWAAANKAAEEEWKRACDVYLKTLHTDPKYVQKALEFIDLQNREPQCLLDNWCWVYRDKVIRLDSAEPKSLCDRATDILHIKHYVLRRERHYERVRREVKHLKTWKG